MTKVLRDLIALRHDRGFSQAEVARRMKVSRQQVNNIETGRQGHPSVKTIEKYAAAVGAKIQIVMKKKSV